MEGQAKEQYDEKGNAKHYSDGRIQQIIIMERGWGTYEVMVFCELTEFKYRARMGKKPEQSIEQELKKANWYAKMAQLLREKIERGEAILAPTKEELINNLTTKI